jgi:hypothetical protein
MVIKAADKRDLRDQGQLVSLSCPGGSRVIQHETELVFYHNSIRSRVALGSKDMTRDPLNYARANANRLERLENHIASFGCRVHRDPMLDLVSKDLTLRTGVILVYCGSHSINNDHGLREILGPADDLDPEKVFLHRCCGCRWSCRCSRSGRGGSCALDLFVEKESD